MITKNLLVYFQIILKEEGCPNTVQELMYDKCISEGFSEETAKEISDSFANIANHLVRAPGTYI